MKRTIAIGMLGLALVANQATAQTVEEQGQILRDFQQRVVDYSQRHKCLNMLPEAISAATPAPKVFTLPAAMVFRQLISQALAPPSGTAIGGLKPTHRAMVLEPFPTTELYEFPAKLSEVLPALPAPLEYRLIDHDLVIRDAEADIIVAVLRDAVGKVYTKH